MTTASQRGTANRRKGLTAERDLCRWLRTNGFPHAERAVRTGFRVGDRVSADPGDVTGTPGIAWSVKDCAVDQPAKWLAELDRMTPAHPSDVRLLVHKRRGHATPARWWCWMRMDALVALADDAETGFVFPVRVELGDALMLLRAAGYGTPIEGVAS
jgi:hypothetical protein